MYAGRVIEDGTVAEVVRNASHPYSHGLMGSIPTIGERAGRLPQIRGGDAAGRRGAGGAAPSRRAAPRSATCAGPSGRP